MIINNNCLGLRELQIKLPSQYLSSTKFLLLDLSELYLSYLKIPGMQFYVLWLKV